MSRLRKRFTSDQLKELLERYLRNDNRGLPLTFDKLKFPSVLTQADGL